ncbi:MAG: Dienelactone hydrolase [Rubritepida sp.]|nr:Dienelactone hydrolase [Rubritepida sp.]
MPPQLAFQDVHHGDTDPRSADQWVSPGAGLRGEPCRVFEAEVAGLCGNGVETARRSGRGLSVMPRHLPRPHVTTGKRGVAMAVLCGMLACTLLAATPGSAGVPHEPGDFGLLWLPDDAAPLVPTAVVITLYEAAGIDARGWPYAEQMTAAGITVLHMELEDTSFDGLGPAVVSDQSLPALARLTAVIDILAEDARFANAPIGILAFGSAGQVATLAAANLVYGNRIAAVALLYPGCVTLHAAVTTQGSGPRSPVLLMHGDADPANLPAECVGLAAELARTAQVHHVQYPGAGYSWDLAPFGPHEVSRLPWPGRPGERLRVTYWPQAAAHSAAEVAGFFATTLAPRRQ